jgi:acetoin utilization deacetylase AcuC-like enzyme
LEAVTAFRPDIVFYIAGVDPLACDRLGRMSVSSDGLIARDRLVLRACQRAGVPVCILIGGGYGEPIEATVSAYANTFAVAREVFG